MPTTEVELDYRHKSFDRIFDLGHRKEGFGMRHEAGLRSIRDARHKTATRTLLSFQA
jgi:hypothetical protein